VFTGIIEALGEVVSRNPSGGGCLLEIDTGLDLEGDSVGDSVAVDGVCLTITGRAKGLFKAFASAETVSRTTLRDTRPGARVNIERALRMGSRLGGHMVLGHVDTVGAILSRRPDGESVRLKIGHDAGFSRWVVEKGSIAVDGVSLTVNEASGGAFTVNIIPHTAGSTSLTGKQAGVRVNLEFDIIGKYVENLLKKGGVAGVDALLDKAGFLHRE